MYYVSWRYSKRLSHERNWTFVAIWPVLCTAMYRNLLPASNFGGTFDQLFLWIFLWFLQKLPLLKKSKMTKNSNQGVGSCKAGPPLSCSSLTFFGWRVLKNLKNVITVCPCAMMVALETQKCRKRHLAPPNLTFNESPQTNAERKTKGWSTKRCLNFLNFSHGLSFDLSKFKGAVSRSIFGDFLPFFLREQKMATSRASVADISLVCRANSFTAPAESGKRRFPRAIVAFQVLALWPPLFSPHKMAAKNHWLSWHSCFNDDFTLFFDFERPWQSLLAKIEKSEAKFCSHEHDEQVCKVSWR